jgi:hypothetical protein
MSHALAPAWTRAVFHVLAHLEVPVPASCAEGAYVAEAATRFGAAEERELGADARALASMLATHDLLARAQALAWVFEGEEDVARLRTRDLREFGDEDVRDATALAVARSAGEAAVEVLRASAELELARVTAWRPEVAPLELADALLRVQSACPELAGFDVALVPALPRRGRVRARSICVGTPGVAGATAPFVAWQAAHEATVATIAAARALPYVALERAAILRLRAGAARAGLVAEHAAWLGALDLRALGPVPDEVDGAEDA